MTQSRVLIRFSVRAVPISELGAGWSVPDKNSGGRKPRPGPGERGEGRAEARIKSGGGTRDYRGAGCDDTSSHREIKHEQESLRISDVN